MINCYNSILHTIISFRYNNALNLRHEVQLYLEQKDHTNAITVLKTMFEKLKLAVNDKSQM